MFSRSTPRIASSLLELEMLPDRLTPTEPLQPSPTGSTDPVPPPMPAVFPVELPVVKPALSRVRLMSPMIGCPLPTYRRFSIFVVIVMLPRRGVRPRWATACCGVGRRRADREVGPVLGGQHLGVRVQVAHADEAGQVVQGRGIAAGDRGHGGGQPGRDVAAVQVLPGRGLQQLGVDLAVDRDALRLAAVAELGVDRDLGAA